MHFYYTRYFDPMTDPLANEEMRDGDDVARHVLLRQQQGQRRQDMPAPTAQRWSEVAPSLEESQRQLGEQRRQIKKR